MQGSGLSVREYAQLEGITICSAYRRIWQQQVPAQRIQGRWLITPEKEVSESTVDRSDLDADSFYGRQVSR